MANRQFTPNGEVTIQSRDKRSGRTLGTRTVLARISAKRITTVGGSMADVFDRASGGQIQNRDSRIYSNYIYTARRYRFTGADWIDLASSGERQET